jgi:hypothetical protein
MYGPSAVPLRKETALSSFTPVVINPGATGTIDVTITPSGAPGAVVSGDLYIDTYSTGLPTAAYSQLAGDELAALRCTYTITSSSGFTSLTR